MVIQSINNQHLTASKTYLSNDYQSGTSLLVKNINNINTSWAVQVGETGFERTEIALVSGTPTNGTVNLTGTLRYQHPTDTPVYCYKYNQVVFERSTSGTAGTASALTNGTITLTPDRFDLYGNSYTIFDDTTGSTGYAYKVKYYNSVLASESPESDWILPSGYDFYSLARMRERAKAKMINNPPDSDVNDWINEWHETMTNALISVNKDYAIGTTQIAFSANQQYGTISANDFKFTRRVWFVGTGTVEMNPMAINEIKPDTVLSEYKPVYFFRGDDVIGRQPYESAGTINIEYYKLNPQLTDDADTLPMPMRGYTKSYVEYARAVAAYKDNDKELGQLLEGNCEAYKNQFIKEMSPRQKSGYEYLRQTVGYETEF